jgi:hypothetical protein
LAGLDAQDLAKGFQQSVEKSKKLRKIESERKLLERLIRSVAPVYGLLDNDVREALREPDPRVFLDTYYPNTPVRCFSVCTTPLKIGTLFNGAFFKGRVWNTFLSTVDAHDGQALVVCRVKRTPWVVGNLYTSFPRKLKMARVVIPAKPGSPDAYVMPLKAFVTENTEETDVG